LIRILLDEHVSPSLVGKLGDKGVLAVAAAHVGLSGEPDAKIWNYAFENDFVVVTGTGTARDFIRLLTVELHRKDKERTGLPGLPIKGPREIAK